jgi:EAL domain-containing protein (putative c-di-GMP-specific phosphodiesterase class I)
MRDLDKRGDSLAIIKAVIGLGHSLGMSTTAEGVETDEQLRAVREQACDEVQGYLFSPPLEPADVLNLLAGEKQKPRLRVVS